MAKDNTMMKIREKILNRQPRQPRQPKRPLSKIHASTITMQAGMQEVRDDIQKRPHMKPVSSMTDLMEKKGAMVPKGRSASPGWGGLSGQKVMKPGDPNWPRFVELLEGPQGCNFREEDGTTKWTCDQSWGRPLAAKILRKFFPAYNLKKSMKVWEDRGGQCDCAILFHVGKGD